MQQTSVADLSMDSYVQLCLRPFILHAGNNNQNNCIWKTNVSTPPLLLLLIMSFFSVRERFSKYRIIHVTWSRIHKTHRNFGLVRIFCEINVDSGLPPSNLWKTLQAAKWKWNQDRVSLFAKTSSQEELAQRCIIFYSAGAPPHFLWTGRISKCVLTAEVTLSGPLVLGAVCLHLRWYLQMPGKTGKLFSVSGLQGKLGITISAMLIATLLLE